MCIRDRVQRTGGGEGRNRKVRPSVEIFALVVSKAERARGYLSLFLFLSLFSIRHTLSYQQNDGSVCDDNVVVANTERRAQMLTKRCPSHTEVRAQSVFLAQHNKSASECFFLLHVHESVRHA